jgi:hypothetical protein
MGMKKSVLVIDNLTETFDGSVVRSGLQKSSKLDARAFSKLGYQTTYMYCGRVVDPGYEYMHYGVNSLGAKDQAMKEGKNPSRVSRHYIKRYLESVKDIIEDHDYIIAHCHSVSMITTLNQLVKNKRIMFIIHDVIDLMWCYGFSDVIRRMRKTDRNMCYIATNSNYSIQKMNDIHERAIKAGYEDIPLRGDDAFDGFIEHFVWTDEKVTSEDIEQVENKSAIIGRYSTDKFHHKVYGYNNPQNTIVHYGVRDPRRDKTGRYFENLQKKANAYMENLPDEELFEAIKTSQSIILPCFHEGFGYTAFEAGIYGVVPVILVKQLDHTQQMIHATSEYLLRANVKHYTADFNNADDIYKAIDESIKVTPEDRRNISRNLLKYFTVTKYVEERISLLDGMEERISSEVDLEDFFV